MHKRSQSTIYTSYIEQFWATVKAKTVNGEVQLQALVDGKKIIITESIVRRDLQLEDDEGVDCLPNATIFEQLTLIGSKTTAWNEFSSTMASAIICLATNQKLNFSKYIFESMVKNLDNVGKFLMYPRSKRKDTEVPQPSGPTTNVADEAVNEEMDDSLVRAATTSSSLEADSGGGPRRQETMGDTIAQTRSENVSKLSNDPLLARVRALETTKPTQANEITGLKRRVKKLEKRNKSRTHGLKILYKGRIADIDANKYIYLVNVHTDEDMFGVNDLDGDEVIVDNVDVVETAEETVNVVVTIVSISSTIPVSAATTTTTTTTTVGDVEITLAQALQKEEEEEGLAREKAQQMKEANIAWDDIQAKIEADFQLAQRLQAQEREEEQTTNKSSTKEYHVYLSEKHGRIEDQKFEEQLEQESSKKQKVEEDKETSKLQSIIEIVYDEEEVSIDAIPLATKPPTIGGDLIRRYSTSMTKKKVATYELKWIKDLVPELWSPVQLKYNQHAYLGTSHWGPKCQSFYGYASNLTSSKDVYSRRRIIAVTRLKIMMKYDQSLLEEIEVRRDDQKLYKFKEGDFKRLRLQDIEDIRIVIQRRVEDLQLGVESYQKKLNLTKLDTYRSNLKNKTAYTSYSDPHEMIYMDQYKRKRLMRADELHKFSDGMLNDVRSARHDIAARIRMEYLPMRK
ncbi:hypothetical protein Tco_1004782 [Tanacetum coccineum]|uniref:Uncharacterized protein n=1 Tax=Tanacetum coccineum TaxID=301880 RepID=A0ABQ5FDY5_9ASTR